MQGFSWVLIVVTVIVAALAVLTALYLLVYYQHPEDRNQANSQSRPNSLGDPAVLIAWVRKARYVSLRAAD